MTGHESPKLRLLQGRSLVGPGTSTITAAPGLVFIPRAGLCACLGILLEAEITHAVPCLPLLPSSLILRDLSDSDGGFCPLLPQCVSSGQHTPSETFKIADSHPEVEDRVEPLSPTKSPLFHNKHRYQKIGVHEVSAGDGNRYNVLYLATGTGNHSLWSSPEFAFPSRAGNPREADETPIAEGSRGVFPAWHMFVKQKRAAKSQYS